jgi:hypothetical protein
MESNDHLDLRYSQLKKYLHPDSDGHSLLSRQSDKEPRLPDLVNIR